MRAVADLTWQSAPDAPCRSADSLSLSSATSCGPPATAADMRSRRDCRSFSQGGVVARRRRRRVRRLKDVTLHPALPASGCRGPTQAADRVAGWGCTSGLQPNLSAAPSAPSDGGHGICAQSTSSERMHCGACSIVRGSTRLVARCGRVPVHAPRRLCAGTGLVVRPTLASTPCCGSAQTICLEPSPTYSSTRALALFGVFHACSEA